MSQARPPIAIVLERNRSIAARVGRVFRCCNVALDVLVEGELATAKAKAEHAPALIACEEADLDRALEWAHEHPRTQVVAWSMDRMSRILQCAEDSTRVASLIAWPPNASMPRPRDLLLAVTRIVSPTMSPSLHDLLLFGAVQHAASPRTSHDRDALVARVGAFGEAIGAGPRLVQAMGEIAHEMLMNAMYDAPVDQYGAAKYAADRTQALSLLAEEVPAFSYGADGMFAGLRVSDPFGGLSRNHVVEGILRGLQAEGRAVLNTSNGGAGLGLYQMYRSSSGLSFDVVPGSQTNVSVWLDLDLTGRDARMVSPSLHLPLQTW